MNINFIFLFLFFLLQGHIVLGQYAFVDNKVDELENLLDCNRMFSDSIDAPDLSYFSLNKMKKARELYEGLGYKAAQEKLLELNRETALDAESMARIANSYRLNGETIEAEQWYRKFIDQNQEPKHFLHYAQVLQINDKCEEAVNWYNKYYQIASKENKVRRSFISNCAEAELMRSARTAIVRELAGVNSDHLEFSPVRYKDGVVFSSTRSKNLFTKSKDSWTNDNFTNLFFASKNEIGIYANVEPFQGFKTSRFHDGAATFNQKGDYMLFTRNRVRSKDEILVLKIFEAHLVNGEWTNIRELPFNSNDFSTCHPTLSPDGKILCFASNRPGGLGGMDIYFSEKVGDTWSEPVNAGAQINTEGNEIFPFIFNETEIYFSSDGHKSIGGLDVFKASRSSTSSMTWKFEHNLGAPINSCYDDFSFYMNSSGEDGFFCSSRNAGTKDDIFEWSFGEEQPVLSETVTVMVIDKATSKPVPNVLVIVRDAKDPNPSSTIMVETNAKGIFEMPVDPEDDLNVQIKTEEYRAYHHKLENIARNDIGYEIFLDKKTASHNVSGNVISATTKLPVPNSMIRFKNKCNNKILETRADGNGNYKIALDCDCEYTVTASKNDFQTVSESLVLEDCKKERRKPIALIPAPTAMQPALTSRKQVKRAEPLALKLEVGKRVVLENIYYDHDKDDIRPDAALRLDQLFKVLSDYPSLEINLLSHTDSRGTEEYNMELSQRRAESAVSYLVNKGISASRLKPIGMGESELLNGCDDGIDCPEGDHQSNRRTEIRVIKMNEEKIEVIYR